MARVQANKVKRYKLLRSIILFTWSERAPTARFVLFLSKVTPKFQVFNLKIFPTKYIEIYVQMHVVHPAAYVHQSGGIFVILSGENCDRRWGLVGHMWPLSGSLQGVGDRCIKPPVLHPSMFGFVSFREIAYFLSLPPTTCT